MLLLPFGSRPPPAPPPPPFPETAPHRCVRLCSSAFTSSRAGGGREPLVHGLAAIVRSRCCSGSRSIAATFVVLFSFAPKRAALITMLSPSLRRVMGKMWHACTTLQRGMRPGGRGPRARAWAYRHLRPRMYQDPDVQWGVRSSYLVDSFSCTGGFRTHYRHTLEAQAGQAQPKGQIHTPFDRAPRGGVSSVGFNCR